MDVSGTADATIAGLTLTGVNTIRLGFNINNSYDNFKLGDATADIGAIPEPTSVALLGIFGGLALLRRRR